jgi:hypothetical protein
MSNDNIKKIFQAAVDQKIDINAYVKPINSDNDVDKCTPLLLYAIHKNFEMMEFLLQNGAHINSQDEDGNTILHYIMAAPGYEDVGAWLISHQASMTLANKDEVTPYDIFMNNQMSKERLGSYDLFLKRMNLDGIINQISKTKFV